MASGRRASTVRSLSHVVARLALGLRVAVLAQACLLALCHRIAVVAQEGVVVLQEGHGQRVAECLRLVTRRALAALPLLRVLVAAEALAHRRQRRALRIDDAGVTRHALAADLRHGEVLVVVDRDVSARARRRRGEHRAHFVSVAVAAFALVGAGGGGAGDRAGPGRGSSRTRHCGLPGAPHGMPARCTAWGNRGGVASLRHATTAATAMVSQSTSGAGEPA